MKGSSMWSYLFAKNDPYQELLELLRGIPVFAKLSRSDVREVERLLHHRKYEPGAVIFKSGDTGLGMYIIISGAVTISLEDDDGSRELVRLGVGTFFGEVSLADASDRTATARAVGNTECLGFFRPELLRLIEQRPALAAKILLPIAEVLGTRLRDANQKNLEYDKLLAAESTKRSVLEEELAKLDQRVPLQSVSGAVGTV